MVFMVCAVLSSLKVFFLFDYIKTTECNTAASSKPNLSDQQTRLLSARPVLSLPSTYFMFLQFASEKLLNVNLFFRGSLSCFYQKNYITENPSFILSLNNHVDYTSYTR